MPLKSPLFSSTHLDGSYKLSLSYRIHYCMLNVLNISIAFQICVQVSIGCLHLLF